jgi:hypothetical protein
MNPSVLATILLQSDPAYWEAMKHRHLVLAYALTWAVQLGYAAWIFVRWRRAGR